MADRLDIPGFRGTLIHPGDAEYDEARTVFNGMIDRRPALIARCTSAEDVSAAVKFARAQRLPISVYGGGHGVTGSAVIDAGLVVDLRGMKAINVDPKAKTVRAEGGLNWGEFDAATFAHGLVCTGGRVTTTGIAGLALGSGSGWLERKYGFTCDNLFEAEVVTADGRIVRASETENSDLFWALRGGGGNFGIVTAFHLRLHELPPLVYAGMLVFPMERAAEVLVAYREFVTDAPDEVGSAFAYLCAPPVDFVPQEAWGMPIAAIVCCYAGPLEEGEQAFAPLRDLEPLMNMTGPMPYVAVQQLLDPANPKGRLNYWSAEFLDDLPDKAVDALTELAGQPVSPYSQVIVMPGGGAISRVDENAMAFGQRHAPWNIHILSQWEDELDSEKNIAHTRAVSASIQPWASGRAYLNFIGDEGGSRVEAAFGPDKYKRLREIKKAWDPDNVFRHNQNIPPAS
jgi:FAD/FMN-containing dehydrogenase